MREIKFRIYNPRDNKIHYDITGFEFDCNGNMTGIFIDGVFFSKEEIELMQYTGLKDKNGKEIYEGDIIKSYYYIDTPNGEQERYHQKEIKFDEISCEYNINAFENLEVIGNIYENPELLKE